MPSWASGAKLLIPCTEQQLNDFELLAASNCKSETWLAAITLRGSRICDGGSVVETINECMSFFDLASEVSTDRPKR